MTRPEIPRDPCGRRAWPRRSFLRLGGSSLVLLAASGAPGIVEELAPTRPGARDGVLVVFFQRGAADGLHMVAPYRERLYRSLRGALALPEPGSGEDRPRDLGDGFALHPKLSALLPLYESRRLAIVHAVGSPDDTRSHFDAQDYMETGTPGVKGTREGWMARALAALPGGAPSPFTAVALASTMPRSLGGARDAIALDDLAAFGSARPSLEARLERMYGAADPELARTGSEAFAALEMLRAKDPMSIRPREGVSYPRGRAGESFRELGALLRAGLGIRVAFLEGGGWDTHFNQGSAQLDRTLAELAEGASALLADVEVPVTLLVVTEFGRTVRVNGSGGTDHGHGTAMMVMGAGVAGGRVAGSWPGLGDLHQGRDLPVTTDFRDLFAEVAGAALGLPPSRALFPGHAPQRPGVMAQGV